MGVSCGQVQGATLQEIVVSTFDALEAQLALYGSGFLFRGQTSHYIDPKTQFVSIRTSFNRHGCVPNLMFKWSHYSKAIVRAFGGGGYHEMSMEMSQAILQHYGWRSFFVDLTKSPSVACWFAAHTYAERRAVHMCEDWEEAPVWLVHQDAQYIESKEQGHLYVIDVAELERCGVGVHDLSKIEAEGGRFRPLVQSACLAGNLKSALPPRSVTTHLVVSHDVLAEYCKKNSLLKTSDVFPSREEDFILKALLDVPWQRLGDGEMPIPTYVRGLPLPEYDCRFKKHLESEIALYSEFWVADNRSDFAELRDVPFFRFSESAYYANSDEAFDLSEVNNFLEKHQSFVVELDGLINIPESRVPYEFDKGIVVERHDDNSVSVSGLVVEHPGQVVAGVGVIRGWYYKVEGGIWKVVPHDDSCPCNNSLRHELQFALLRILNESLRENELVPIDAVNWVHKNICRTSGNAKQPT